MKDIKRKRRPLTELYLGMDRNDWLPVEGVADMELAQGTFKLDSGKEHQGTHLTIHIDHVKYDDGQSAIDIALNKRGKLRVRIPSHNKRRALLGEMEPYDVDAVGGRRYIVKARLTNTQWEGAPNPIPGAS